MCNDCNDKFEALAGCPAKVKAAWRCLVCGEQEFEKEPDPDGSQRPVVYRQAHDWPLIVFWIGLFTFLTAYFVARAFKS